MRSLAGPLRLEERTPSVKQITATLAAILILVGAARGEPRPPAASPLVDVVLSRGGDLHGVVLAPSGRPVAAARVVAWRNARIDGGAETETGGQFTIRGLNPGLVTVNSAGGTAFCRVWTAAAAPPGATRRLLLVAGSTITRGAGPAMEFLKSDVFLYGVVIGGAVAVPIAVHNSQSDGPSE